jgi:hypothetical protein
LKRKIAEIMVVNSSGPSNSTTKKRHIPGFSDNEKVNGCSNKILQIVVVANIHNHDIARRLLDEGSACDIVYEDVIEMMGLKK